MNFKHWVPLQLIEVIDSDLLRRVRLAYVFGKTGQEAFIVTEDDDVFACGPNFSYCLGVNKERPQLKPVRVPELCQKKVKGFSYSLHSDGAFICAYTFDNTLYRWGKCSNWSYTYETPSLSEMNEIATKVLEVVSGPNHCLILTSDGQIFSFGDNEYGQLGRYRSYTGIPALVEGMTGKFVVKVSCGANFSVAVLDNGEVFTFGCNNYGQLGNRDTYEERFEPTKVLGLTNVIIKNIICGKSYVLAVSEGSELYTWGENDVGQLGLGHTKSCFTPKKLENIGKVIDIAATCYGSTTAVMIESNEVYMWGACGDSILEEPTKTEFDNLYDVFAFFSNPRIMHKPMLRVNQLNSVSDTIRNAFGDSETSDLTIVVDGKEIFVHKVILMLRSNYFKVMLQKQWLKNDKKVIMIKQNYDALHAYLQYLYTGNFEGNSVVALETLKIAHEYHDLVLKKICENHVKRGVTVENVADLYVLGSQLDTKDLVKHCVIFAGKHVGKIIDTAGFSEWDVDTHKQFFRDCHKENVFK